MRLVKYNLGKSLQMHVYGLPELVQRLTVHLPAAAMKGAQAGVDKAAKILLARSDHYVPEDKGNLRYSGRIVSSKLTKGHIALASVEYGGPDAPYALMVHEWARRARHGEEYNDAYGEGLRRPQETAFWVAKAAREKRAEMERVWTKSVETSLRSICRYPLKYGYVKGGRAVAASRNILNQLGRGRV